MNESAATGLRTLGLAKQESAIYLALLRQPATYAQLSHTTGINRTTLYRVVSGLVKQGLVTNRVDDRGKYLVAASPETLEAGVVTQEARAKQQRVALNRILPLLQTAQDSPMGDFTIHTYEGTEGFKRMLWHELKAKADCLCIGYSSLEDLVPNHEWAEKHRQLTVEAGYRVREICNPSGAFESFTANPKYMQNYEMRVVPGEMLPVNQHIVTYNDTVSIYHTVEGRIGLEITSKTFAKTVRSIFGLYWGLSRDVGLGREQVGGDSN